MYHVMALSDSTFRDIDVLRSQYHVWFVEPDRVTSSALLESCRTLLSTDERQRHSRFRFPEDRHHYLVSHALVRRVLSCYWPLEPRQWQFSTGEHGRPEIANPGMPALRFNLTHTRGLAACIVSLDVACGIDAEYITTRHNPTDVAARMFSAQENARLQTLDGRAALEYFYTGWTLREAYIKARGLGLSFPTHKLHFRTENVQGIRVQFGPGVDDTDSHWQFRLLRPTGEHILGIACRCGQPPARKLISRRFAF